MSEENKRLYSVKAVMEYLDISRTTLYKLISSGQLLPIKLGKSVKFDTADIDLFIDKKKGKTNEIIRRTKSK